MEVDDTEINADHTEMTDNDQKQMEVDHLQMDANHKEMTDADYKQMVDDHTDADHTDKITKKSDTSVHNVYSYRLWHKPCQKPSSRSSSEWLFLPFGDHRTQ